MTFKWLGKDVEFEIPVHNNYKERGKMNNDDLKHLMGKFKESLDSSTLTLKKRIKKVDMQLTYDEGYSDGFDDGKNGEGYDEENGWENSTTKNNMEG